MESDKKLEITEYETPEVVDYGTLLELTSLNGTVHPADVHGGKPGTAYPS